MLQTQARALRALPLACVLAMTAEASVLAQQVTLDAQPQTNAAAFRKQVGRRLTFVCPAHVNINQDIYGTDNYTDTSPICAAAAHAGVFTRGTSTAVTIVMEGEKPSFTASTRNSVKSLAYGPWSGSYSFVRTGQPGQIDWYTTIASVAADYSTPITLVCPPVQSERGEIWGTDVYPFDSAICVAGVHAGAIPLTGGGLTVTRVAKQASFPSTTRNSITSKMWSDPAWRSYPQPYSLAAAKVDGGVVTTDRGGTGGSSSGSAPFAVTVTPGTTGPVVTWTAALNATGYIVSRSKIDDLNCCNITSGRTYTATSPWQDQPLPMSGTYVYKVTASTPAGSVIAEAQYGFRIPGDNTAVGTPTVNAVLVQPTTTGTITPMTTSTTSSTSTTGTIVTERAPGGGAPTSMNGPAPTNLRFSGVPPIVRISWDPPAGVSSYGINWKQASAATWNLSPKPLPSTLTDFDFRIEDPTQTYSYQVVAYQADGRYGTVSGDFKPTPLEPAGFTATAIGPGQVRFEWDNIEKQFPSYLQLGRTTTYLLSGPGTGNGVMVVGSSKSVTERNTYTLQGIPAGVQTWTLTVAWPAVITPSTSWPKASATVPAVAADPVPRYRLVALGFRALQQSKDIDDARDGHGDEVFFSAIVNRTQLTGLPLPVTKGANLTMVTSRSHGDEAVSVPYGRIKAGTASATGGIRSGDAVPANLDPAAPTGALQTLTFPLVVWEGELRDSEVVVVHPTLWEDDVNPIVPSTWAKAIIDAAASGYVVKPAPSCDTSGCYALVIPTDADTSHRTAARIFDMNAQSLASGAGIRGISNGLEPDLMRSRSMGDAIFTCTVDAVNLVRRRCEAHGVDRPIGLEAYNTNGTVEWFDRLIFLSRASVDAALTGAQYAPYMTWPRGTFSLKLRDQISSKPLDIEAVASYDLFFRIERVR